MNRPLQQGGEVQGVKVTTIGGGTGSFTILSRLKYHVAHINAIVNMVDDGGSTGLLRDQLGILPPGDVRQCLVALANSPELWRELFTFRFSSGQFSGHCFGNIFLGALEQHTGSFDQAVALASELLQTAGSVIPVTLENIRLKLKLSCGEEIMGEHEITDTSFAHDRGARLSLVPQAPINPLAKEAIYNADIVTVGPGNLYSSIIPTLLVEGVADALRETQAKVVYICNLMTKPGQTDGFFVHDFVEEIGKYVGKDWCDFVLYNTQSPTEEMLARYAYQGEVPVAYDKEVLDRASYRAIGKNFVNPEVAKQSASDTLLARTLIRHNAEAVVRAIMRIYYYDES